MSTQKIDGLWTEIKELPEAFEEFTDLLFSGNVKKFVCGTPDEIKKEQKQSEIEQEISELKARIDALEPLKSKHIVIPNQEQIDKLREEK
jgi:outer membrane murein-binding lipoprotein Lpp